MKKTTTFLIILGVIIIVISSALIFLIFQKQIKTKGIEIYSLRSGERITFPLNIKGRITGNGWNGFEGQVGVVRLLNEKGEQLSLGILNASSDWMSLPTEFETRLTFKSDKEQKGTLVFRNENAAGIPEKDRFFTIDVNIPKIETTKVQVFFGNMALSSSDEQDECKRVYPVDRYVNNTKAIGGAAIEELLKGPTKEEEAQGYFTSIPNGSQLKNLSIEEGDAKANFNSLTESGGGSCSMVSRIEQIKQTLKQFSTVDSVYLSINGRIEDIFQP